MCVRARAQFPEVGTYTIPLIGWIGEWRRRGGGGLTKNYSIDSINKDVKLYESKSLEM